MGSGVIKAAMIKNPMIKTGLSNVDKFRFGAIKTLLTRAAAINGGVISSSGIERTMITPHYDWPPCSRRMRSPGRWR